MTPDVLRTRLREIVVDAIEIQDFQDDQHFIHDLGINSMLAIEVLARIEKEYRVRFPEVVLTRVQTFNDIVKLTEETLRAVSAN